MFGRYRLLIVALGGFLTVSLWGGIALSEDTTNPPKSTEQTKPAQDGENKPAPPQEPPSVEQESSPPNVEGDGGRDQEYYPREDLAAQQSMADSTKELVHLADNQNLITIAESTLLAITIFFTAWASIAASRAAKAADAAVEITEKTGRAQLRAYVGVIEMTLDDPGGFHCRVQYRNCGHTPAHNLTSWTAWETGDDICFVDHTEECRVGPSRDLAPGVEGSLIIPIEFKSPEVMKAVMNKRSIPMYVWGGIRYIDAFNKVRTTKFRARLAHPHENTMPGFMLLSCEDGNDAT